LKHFKLVLMFFAAFFICQTSASAESIVKKLDATITKTIDTEIETQKINSEWNNEKSVLKNRFENLQHINHRLKKELERIESVYAMEQEKYSQILRKQEQTEKIKNELDNFLENVVSELETFVKKDLPFHLEEREQRLIKLKELLLNNEIKSAEKYRQIFEALKTETDYGKTIEVYQKEINSGSETKTADILRIGRVSLFYLTPDKTESGFFNPLSSNYEKLSSKYNSKIEKAASIAKGEQISEFVDLPFGRIAR